MVTSACVAARASAFVADGVVPLAVVVEPLDVLVL